VLISTLLGWGHAGCFLSKYCIGGKSVAASRVNLFLAPPHSSPARPARFFSCTSEHIEGFWNVTDFKTIRKTIRIFAKVAKMSFARIKSCIWSWARPVATGGFGGLSLPNKAPCPPNWSMKHYKSVEFLSNFNVKPPLHKRKAYPRKRKASLLTTFWRLLWAETRFFSFCLTCSSFQVNYGIIRTICFLRNEIAVLFLWFSEKIDRRSSSNQPRKEWKPVSARKRTFAK